MKEIELFVELKKLKKYERNIEKIRKKRNIQVEKMNSIENKN